MLQQAYVLHYFEFEEVKGASSQWGTTGLSRRPGCALNVATNCLPATGKKEGPRRRKEHNPGQKNWTWQLSSRTSTTLSAKRRRVRTGRAVWRKNAIRAAAAQSGEADPTPASRPSAEES